ncbi:glycosyltransferase family 2 protein [Desulforhabdus amnigena]|jgi:glycosyltransferase involved in cell wall biosynthesis|uniref:Glycosyl transferase n=1 Tax=Desulforhabdus amnigena TaxID=40218 RepID=A0A9W6FTR9_9BACT|nr:glycosyltransferase family 2 protein [Desulforhabdus amnigena]NLJ29739.1 glycosyltransferase family 2 protein [Deltaproteobacteria bacterium]GLI33981.1 glycosyl transferase [Desulforhabdus amnigena]
MKKLIIQIPCYNEEQTLGITLSSLPRDVPGVDKVEWLVIDDGSRDRTVEVAREHGVDHIVRHPRNLGLARAFMKGIDASLLAGADVIVNTDADNQYNAEDIRKLIAPILEGEAELVIGDRPIGDIEDFSILKKTLQRMGSWVVRKVSGTSVQDAPSGFRAISRSAARRLIVFDSYTYTLETIIQAGKQGIAVVSVPIRTNGKLRESRLVRSIPSYVARSIQTILRIYIIYSPFKFFMTLSGMSFLLSIGFFCIFLYFFAMGREDTHIPTLLTSGLFFLFALFLLILGILADLLAINRKLLEDIRRRLFRLEENHPASERGLSEALEEME